MTVDERIRELRQRAYHLRQIAQYADSRAAYNDDMQAAARLEDEADELAAQQQDAQS